MLFARSFHVISVPTFVYVFALPFLAFLSVSAWECLKCTYLLFRSSYTKTLIAIWITAYIYRFTLLLTVSALEARLVLACRPYLSMAPRPKLQNSLRRRGMRDMARVLGWWRIFIPTIIVAGTLASRMWLSEPYGVKSVGLWFYISWLPLSVAVKVVITTAYLRYMAYIDCPDLDNEAKRCTAMQEYVLESMTSAWLLWAVIAVGVLLIADPEIQRHRHALRTTQEVAINLREELEDIREELLRMQEARNADSDVARAERLMDTLIALDKTLGRMEHEDY